MSGKIEITNVALAAIQRYVAEQKKRSFSRWKDVYVQKPGAWMIDVVTPTQTITLHFGTDRFTYPIDGYPQTKTYKSLPGVGPFFSTGWLYDPQASSALVQAMAPYLLADLDDAMSTMRADDPRRFAQLGGLKAATGRSKRKPWWQVW